MAKPEPSSVWTRLTGIDTFIPRGIDRVRLTNALQNAFDLPADAIVDGADHEGCIAALTNHKRTVKLFSLGGPRFAWKCDIDLFVLGDLRPRLIALSIHLKSEFAAMDESKPHGDCLIVFHPDETCTKDYLQPGDIDAD
jgi:hypothetical protein